MPFLAPLIAVGLGVGGSALAVSAIQVGLAVGLSYAATKLRPKQKGARAPGGVRLGLRIDTNPPRQVIIGEAATSGSLVYWQLSGTDNKVLHMVFALADHECNSLQKVLVNNKEKARDSGSGEISGYSDKLIVRFYSGASGQTADSDLVSTSGGRWTSDDKGTGVCYVVVKMTYDEALFPEGIPEFGFVVRGIKLTDPRTGTDAYSDNPACAIYTILRGITVGGEKLLGMNVPTDAIRQSEAEAAANACDELIAKKAGGTEKRYRCNVIFDATQSSRDIIETLLASMAGEVIEAGGIYRIIAGVAQTPVAHLTDADLIVTEPFVTRPRRSRNELVNAIQGSYTDPSRAYGSVALPPRTSSDDEDEDGGIRLTRSLDLVAVTSRSQAQRILEVERRRARRMASASMKLRARWIGLEPGDWVTFSSDRRGYEEKTFVIQSKTGARDLTSDIVLVETDAGIDDWTASTDEIDDDQVIDLASAGPSLSAVSGIDLDAVVIEGASGQQRPALQILWDAIDDPTVISLALEYRKVGDSVALKRTILDPSTGAYTWADGVQGGVTYEARLRPITQPQRTTTWSSWVTSASEAEPQIVAVAAYAQTVDPDSLPPAELSAQDRIELELVTKRGDVANSVNARIEEAIRQAQEAAAAAMGALAENTMLMRGVRATSGANAIAITETLSAVGGADTLAAQWTVAIDLNGNVIGLVQLSGDLDYSQFSVVADRFSYAMPGAAPGDPATPVFSIVTLEGEQVAVLNGELIANAIKANQVQVVSLDAISANFGTMTAGLIRDIANTYRIEVANGLWRRTDNKSYIDMKTNKFRFSS